MRIHGRIISSVILVTAFAATRSAWPSDVTGDVDRAIAAAELSIKAGKLVDARQDLQIALTQDPHNAKANLELGLLFGQEENLPAAQEAFRIAVREAPNWPEAHYNLGLILIADWTGKRDWPAAVSEFREAVRLRPDYADARHWLGTGLSEMGDQEGALRELRAAEVANPGSPDIRLHLGKSLEELRENAEAEREYREAVHLRPGFAEAEVALGQLLLKAGGDLEAIEHFKRALRSDPDLLAAHYGLALALKKDASPVEADISLRQAAALTKKVEQGIRSTRLSNEGLDAAHHADRKGAIKLLREALNLKPDNALAHYNLGLMLADDGELGDAAGQLIEAISLAPLEVRFYLSLGRIWKLSGQVQRARRAFERTLALDPADTAARSELQSLPEESSTERPDDQFLFGAPTNTPDAHFAFASVLGNRGDWLGAIGEWLRVLGLQPGNVDARNNLGVSYAHLAEDENAELEFRKALAVANDSAGAHFGLAVLEMQQGKKVEAAQELREVLRVQPDYPQARNLLSVAMH